MSLNIANTKPKSICPKSLEEYLPARICEEINSLGNSISKIEEIRLRSGGHVSLTTNKGNLFLRSTLSYSEIKDVLAAMCNNSLYAHSDTINNGYITLRGGIRVGICGRAAIDGGKVLGVYDISSLNIRIPLVLKNLGDPICRLLREMRENTGVLVYSPPGVGKTTLLRSVAYRMASGAGAWRVALIDSRGELGTYEENRCAAIDILSGYPKPLGIEIAARTMNAQLMVCDEIGDKEEANAIISAQNCGVPLLASAHGDNILGLLRRPQILKLHNARVFGAYVRITRGISGGEYVYEIKKVEEADALLQNSRSADCSF